MYNFLYLPQIIADFIVLMQGYKHTKAYMIAEGPMASTTRNMWKVIHDRKCGAIVMLSNLVENGMASKCMYLFHMVFFLLFFFYKLSSMFCYPWLP